MKFHISVKDKKLNIRIYLIEIYSLTEKKF